MQKRSFKVLPDIAIEGPNGDPLLLDGRQVTVSHVDFIRSRTTDGVFGKDMDSVVLSVEIRSAIRGKSSGDQIILDEDAWDLLVTSIRSPSTIFYNTDIAPQIVSFMRAVTDAVVA